MPKVDFNGCALSSRADAHPSSSDQSYTVTVAGVAGGAYLMGVRQPPK